MSRVSDEDIAFLLRHPFGPQVETASMKVHMLNLAADCRDARALIASATADRVRLGDENERYLRSLSDVTERLARANEREVRQETRALAARAALAEYQEQHRAEGQAAIQQMERADKLDADLAAILGCEKCGGAGWLWKDAWQEARSGRPCDGPCAEPRKRRGKA